MGEVRLRWPLKFLLAPKYWLYNQDSFPISASETVLQRPLVSRADGFPTPPTRTPTSPTSHTLPLGLSGALPLIHFHFSKALCCCSISHPRGKSESESRSVVSDSLSMEFSRPEHWSGLFPSPGDLPNPGIEPRSPALKADSLPTEISGKSLQGQTCLLLQVSLDFLLLHYNLQWWIEHHFFDVSSRRSSRSSSDQISHSVVSYSLRPHESQHARPPCPSPTPGVHSDSCPSSQRCHAAISSSVVPSPPALNPSKHQSLFQWVNSSHEVAKVLEFQF